VHRAANKMPQIEVHGTNEPGKCEAEFQRIIENFMKFDSHLAAN